MPSFYTHHHFGRDLMKLCPNRIRKVIDVDTDLFLFGNQGPDLFFFNIPAALKGSNPGTAIHNTKFVDVLDKLKENVKSAGLNSEVASYFLGLTSHFYLDSSLHPTVNRLSKKGFGHLDIESELDRYYFRKDGIDENKFKQSTLIPNKTQAKYVYPVYENFEGVSLDEVKKSMSYFKIVKNIFHNSSKTKEKFILSTLKMIGRYDDFAGQLMRRTPFMEAQQTNEILSKMYTETLKTAPEFLDATIEYVFNNGKELPEYRKDFNGV